MGEEGSFARLTGLQADLGAEEGDGSLRVLTVSLCLCGQDLGEMLWLSRSQFPNT